MIYTDCSKRGGYASEDPCGHTCNDNHVNNIMCPQTFVAVNCDNKGGFYEPDHCRVTCNGDL